MRLDYAYIVDQVRSHGDHVTTRGMFAREVLGLQVEFPAGLMVSRERINRALGWVELLQLIAGTFDPDALKGAAPGADHSLFTHQMAYWPRIKRQVPNAIKELEHDQGSRRAVLYLREEMDTPDTIPCTTSIQFLIRDGQLKTIVSMRSWDLIKGMAYDIVMFGGLAMAVAGALEVPAGQVVVTAGSAHVYDTDDHVSNLSTGPRFALTERHTWPGYAVWAASQLRLVRENPATAKRPFGISVEQSAL